VLVEQADEAAVITHGDVPGGLVAHPHRQPVQQVAVDVHAVPYVARSVVVPLSWHFSVMDLPSPVDNVDRNAAAGSSAPHTW
jgi:hypothetical protein